MARPSIGQQLAALQEQFSALRRSSHLGASSIEGGAVQVYDSEGRLRMIVGEQADGTTDAAVVSGPPPPTPSAPLVTPALAGLRARWNGSFTDAQVPPMDWSRVEVHVGTSADFTCDQSTLRDTIETAQGGEVLLPFLQYTPYWVRLRARSKAGTAGNASASTSGTPLQADAADIKTGAIDANHIRAGAIVADQVAAGVLTGSVVRTAAAGARVEMTPHDPVQNAPATVYWPDPGDGLLPGRIVTRVDTPPLGPDPSTPQAPTTGWLAMYAPRHPSVTGAAKVQLRTGISGGTGSVRGVANLTTEDGSGFTTIGATDVSNAGTDMYAIDRKIVTDPGNHNEYRASLNTFSFWVFQNRYKNGVLGAPKRLAEFEFRPGQNSQVTGLGIDAADGSRIDGRIDWSSERIAISSALVPKDAAVPSRTDAAAWFDLRAGMTSALTARGTAAADGSRIDTRMGLSETRFAVWGMSYKPDGTYDRDTAVPLWVDMRPGRHHYLTSKGVPEANGTNRQTSFYVRDDYVIITGSNRDAAGLLGVDQVMYIDTRPAVDQGGTRKHYVNGYWYRSDWKGLTPAAGWSHGTGVDGAAVARLTPDNSIKFAGILKPATTPSGTAAILIGTLPAGVATARNQRVLACTNDKGGTGTVLIQPTGEVLLLGWTGGNVSYVSLAGTSVPIDA
ncbi:hypothetical protein [Embleya sp. NPDC059237]|uniref:hypothetical protein n=1 Tax=Embleya sp. NPDC059237 TaxID=3346784 RepID=UPI0036A23874